MQPEDSPAAPAVAGENPDAFRREHGVEAAGELTCTIPDQELDRGRELPPHTVLQGRYSVTECWPGCPCSTTSLARSAVINPLQIAIAGELTGRHRSVVGLKNTTPRRVSGRKGAGTLRACAAQAGVPVRP